MIVYIAKNMVKRYSNKKYGGDYCDDKYIEQNIVSACEGLEGIKYDNCAKNIRDACKNQPRAVTHGINSKKCCTYECLEEKCKKNPKTSVEPYLSKCVDETKKLCSSNGGKRKSVKKPKNKRKRNARKSIKSMFSKMFK